VLDRPGQGLRLGLANRLDRRLREGLRHRLASKLAVRHLCKLSGRQVLKLRKGPLNEQTEGLPDRLQGKLRKGLLRGRPLDVNYQGLTLP